MGSHPFACSASLLAEVLGGIGPGLEWLAGQAAERWATLALPSLSGVPTASPELLSGRAPNAVSLRAWRVPALVFGPAESAQLLGELFDPQWALTSSDVPGVGRADVAYGASLRWLTGVHDLAWRLVGRGQVLPGLVRPISVQAEPEPEPEAGAAPVRPGLEAGMVPAPVPVRPELGSGLGLVEAEVPEDEVAYARWRPVPTAADRRAATALADGCPRVLRGERSGAVLVDEVLDVLTDREVRATLADHPGALRIPRGSAPADGPAARLAERWFTALASPDGRITVEDGDGDGAAAALDELAARLTAWYASGVPAEPALRLCFRLVEPLGPDPTDPEGRAVGDHWRIDFLLQAVDEPSLLVSAAELWAGGAALAAFERKTDDPQAGYLAELDRAARCRAELRPALRETRPKALTLDRDGALEFLREAAPVLAEAGFGVLLPTWWQRRPRLGMALTVRGPATAAVERTERLDRDAVLAFHWQLAVDGDPLTEQELADLAAAKRGLVRVRGQWIEVDARQIAAAVDFLAKQGQGESDPGPLLRLALDPGSLVAGLPIGAIRAAGVLGELLGDGSGEDGNGGDGSGEGGNGGDGSGGDGSDSVARAAVRLPAEFGATLRPYQERGVAWLSALSRLGLGAVLADDMGLGKTVQTLALLAAEHAADRSAGPGATDPGRVDPGRVDPGRTDRGPTLLVCPMSLVANWRREAARFAPMLRVHVQHGAERPLGEELHAAVTGADLVITTYGLVQRDAPQLRTIAWHRVIADEAQTVKNSATAQSRALRSIPAAHRIALTGTPVENRLAELHAILDFANPGLLGSAAAFKERYAVPVEQQASVARTAELRRRTGPFILRRRKGDPGVLAELPAKQEMTVWCTLTAEQAGLYQAVVADLLHRLRGIKGVERKGAVLGAIGRLKQVCNHPAQLPHDGSPVAGRSGKLARLEELLTEALAEGDRTLVFTQYAEFGSLLHRHLAERLDTEVLYLHGRLGASRREELITRFQQPDGPGVFLLSLKAGGTGLNLTAANQVIHLDRWWNPAVEEQATDRAHRIGQRRTVQVRRFVCAGTVEERIAEMIDSKRALADVAVGQGERWLTELSTGELRELLTLSQEAMTE
ncbi:DEAD/DEAH box helicase [Kitasatospora azatica]|uniref:DEAD/DEAH box helicase n=1 Tax=Kitasatospora azatica TaxID=58347 RepID=UPI000690D6B5|nr:DEAD/DEAH box helicase [Kitasatospora azatica]